MGYQKTGHFDKQSVWLQACSNKTGLPPRPDCLSRQGGVSLIREVGFVQHACSSVGFGLDDIDVNGLIAHQFEDVQIGEGTSVGHHSKSL